MSATLSSRSPDRNRRPRTSRPARGRSEAGPAPREILAVGISSRTCWKAHRLNGGSCQFASVTRDCGGNGGAPLISAGRPPAWSVADDDAAISATAGGPFRRGPKDPYILL